MSVYIDANSRLHHDPERSLALNAHTVRRSRITAVSIPQYGELVASRPGRLASYRCDSCSAPIFLKYPVKMYASNRVELANSFVELERAREKFSFTYLPEESEKLLRETLACYSAGLFGAFASMCRRTAQAVFHDLGENGRLRTFDPIAERTRDGRNRSRDVRGAEESAVRQRRRNLSFAPELGPDEAGVLLELLKDVLYQAYVRRGKLQQATMVRRFFADESADKVTPIGRAAAKTID